MGYVTSDDIVLALQNDSELDPRTGNKVLYAASWLADTNSMIGERKESWVKRELEWFLSGSDSLTDMEPPVPKAFQACAGPDHTVNSAYGHILFDTGAVPPIIKGGISYKMSLYDRIVTTLFDEGLETRHAVVIISDRNIHSLAYEYGKKDFICTNALNVMVNTAGEVSIIAQMRSMDAVWGYRADYSMWDLLMTLILDDERLSLLNLKRGNIIFQVANLHVYPRHFNLLEETADKIDDKLDREARRQWIDRNIPNYPA